MKLSDLDAGTLFQFVRKQRTSNIYMAVRPAEGVYRIVGMFVQGEPVPFCGFSDCKEHGQTLKTEKPGRAVKRRHISPESPLYQWLTGEVEYVTSSAGHPHRSL